MLSTTSGQQTGSCAQASADVSPDELKELYRQMVLLRQFELAAQQLYKKGELPGFIHLYIGEEAVAVGVCSQLRHTDWITSTHRGHGHAIAKGMTVRSLMAELSAKATGCCGGRGGSMHLYDREHGVFGTNGIVAGGIPHAVGAALSARVKKTDDVAVAFFGDGAVNHGAFHESMNLAAAQNAGVVFVCENNLYATATPLALATRNTAIASKAAAYGMPSVVVDGNDVLAVREAAREAVTRARRGGGPTLIEAKTYRTVGHHEGDPLVGTYRSQEELDAWLKRCPISNFRIRLLGEYVIAAEAIETIDREVNAAVEDAVEFARRSPEPEPSSRSRHAWSEHISQAWEAPAVSLLGVQTSWLDAVRDGIAEEMRRNPHVIYLGEGIGERAGSFAHTKGLWKEFGGGRVIDTPICELGFTGAAIGSSATGCPAIADLMFADFLFETGGQLPLQATKLRYMSNGQMTAPLVVRAPCGAIKSAGPHHSGTYHSLWAHLTGLVVAVPSNPADAKGLIKTALRGGDPVLFMEPKALFSSKGLVPEGDISIPFGIARIARAGSSLTIVAAGRMVPLVLQAADGLGKEGVDCEVIDLRTIVPLDVNTIISSLEKTNRLLVVDEGYSMCGIGAEIAAVVGEMAFDSLDAPVGRLNTESIPHPFSPKLEAAMLPSVELIIQAARQVIAGTPPQPSRLVVTRPAVSAPPSPPSPPLQPETKNTEEMKSSVAPSVVSAAIPSTGETPIQLPHGDLTVSEAKVVAWRKKVGDLVAKGDVVLEVETDKAVLEVEAEKPGRLTRIVAPVETVVPMGGVLGFLGEP
jgi:2-oxoisovalerate dehydrogenase E1 component